MKKITLKTIGIALAFLLVPTLVLAVANVTLQRTGTKEALQFQGDSLGVGSTTPYAKLSVHANNGETNTTLFAIASSTRTATTTVLAFNTPFSTSGAGSLPYLNINNALQIGQLPSAASIAAVGGIYSFNGSTLSGVVLGFNPGAAANASYIENTTTGGGTARDLVIRNSGVETVRFKTGAIGSMTFGGTTNAFPSLVRSTTALTVNLADGSLGGGFGVGTSSPFAKLAIHADNGETNTTLFAIASSTATATTTLFYVNNDGTMFAPSTASSGSAQTGYWCYDANGQFIRDTTTCLVSAAKFKKDIKPLDIGLKELMKVEPVTYYNKDSQFGAGQQIGVIADQVAKIDERLIVHDSNGDIHGFNYEQYTAWITKAVQELNDKVDGKTIVAHAARSAEENWQWGAIVALVLWNILLTFKRIK